MKLKLSRDLGGIINQKSDQDLFTVDARRDSSLVPFDQPKRMRIDEILKPNSSFSLPTSKFLSKKAILPRKSNQLGKVCGN